MEQLHAARREDIRRRNTVKGDLLLLLLLEQLPYAKLWYLRSLVDRMDSSKYLNSVSELY